LVEGLAAPRAARCSKLIGDLDVVDARAGSGDGELFANALLKEAIAEKDFASFQGEAVAVLAMAKTKSGPGPAFPPR
jgi:hypothetical protein